MSTDEILDQVNLTETDQRKFLTTTDVCQLLKVGARKVLHWIDTEQLRAIDIGSGSTPQFRIDPRAFSNFLSTRTWKQEQEQAKD